MRSQEFTTQTTRHTAEDVLNSSPPKNYCSVESRGELVKGGETANKKIFQDGGFCDNIKKKKKSTYHHKAEMTARKYLSNKFSDCRITHWNPNSHYLGAAALQRT